MIAQTAKAAWWAGGLCATALVALAAEIPKPEEFWPVSVGGWTALVLGTVSVLGVLRLLVWPATEAQLRKALEGRETRRTIVAIVKEEFKERMAWQEQIRTDVDASMGRLDMMENAILQQGRSIEQMPDMVKALQRIEDQIETVTNTWTRALEVMERRGSQIDRIEGQLQSWGGEERRRRPR